ncbi:MAG: hypothetical protein WBG36_03625 [Ornithinimicrobium sp.]
MPKRALNTEVLAESDTALSATDDMLASSYPSDQGRWQPVHMVYVPADRFSVDLPAQWGHQASE